jgi:hypothetical protein
LISSTSAPATVVHASRYVTGDVVPPVSPATAATSAAPVGGTAAHTGSRSRAFTGAG